MLLFIKLDAEFPIVFQNLYLLFTCLSRACTCEVADLSSLKFEKKAIDIHVMHLGVVWSNLEKNIYTIIV